MEIAIALPVEALRWRGPCSAELRAASAHPASAALATPAGVARATPAAPGDGRCQRASGVGGIDGPFSAE
jgi:hypothetical protein